MNQRIGTPIEIIIDTDKVYFEPKSVKIKLGLPVRKTKAGYYGGNPVTMSALDIEGQKGSLTFDAFPNPDNIDTLKKFATTTTSPTVVVTFDDNKKYTFTSASITEDPEIGYGIDGTIPWKIESNVVTISSASVASNTTK